MLKKILNSKFHLRFTFNPYVRFKSENLGKRVCVNQLKREIPIIVSITSYAERFDELELALYSIMDQSIMPDRIILWLSDKYESLNYIPYSITKYIKNGLEIRFVRDLGSYTKFIYAIKENPDSIIVTADDDIIYPKKWLERLYHSYVAHPNDIQVHRAHRVRMENGVISPYETWEKHVNEETARYDNFLTGVGGVLYPPNCFSKEIFREDIFLKQAPCADDIWLWIMALASKRKIRVVKNHMNSLTCADFWGHIGLKKRKNLYSKNKNGENDKQLNALMSFYKQNIYSKLKLAYNKSP